jgi:hypothetical protein
MNCISGFIVLYYYEVKLRFHFKINILHYNNLADQVRENEVSRTCGTHGRGMSTRFWWEIQKERDHLKDHERMGSEWILGRFAGGV